MGKENISPIEAAKEEQKIHDLAVEYCNKTTTKSADDGVKLFCIKDFMAGFHKCQEVNKSNEKELLDCIHNLMAIIDSPVGRRQIKGDFADEARKIGRDILEKNNINLYGQ